MKYKSLFLSIPLLCLVACSSNDDNEEVEKAPARPIRVEVSEIPMIDSLADNTGVKRAPITTVGSLDEFYMNYYYNGEFSDSYLWTNTITTAGQWEWNSQMDVAAWPQGAGNDDPVPFYAYAVADWGQQQEEGTCYLDDDDKVKLDFSMDENSGETKDLLVSKCVKSYSQDGTLHFTFSHACAAMQFTICKTAKLESLEIQVKEIIIHNLVSNAQYVFDDVQNPWVLDDVYSNYTIKAYTPGQMGGSIMVGPEPAALVGDGETDYVFAIPQNITPWSGTGALGNTYAEIKCSIKKGDNQYAQNPDSNGFGSVYIPFTVPQLKQGYVHHVKIVMGTALKKNDGSSIFQ